MSPLPDSDDATPARHACPEREQRMSEPTDPRIVHVASELDVPLGPQAENDGNVGYILDVIAAVDYANDYADVVMLVADHVKALRQAEQRVMQRVRKALEAVEWGFYGPDGDQHRYVVRDDMWAALDWEDSDE